MADAPVDRSGCPYTGARHGTAWVYRWGCRCPDAREAHRLYRKRWREHRLPPSTVDATGTVRRIRALMAVGHNGVTIAAAAQRDPRMVHRILSEHTTVRVRTAAVFARVYDDLYAVDGTSAVTRARAAAAGWPGPEAWTDATIDDPTAQPYTGPDREPDNVAVELRLAGGEVPLTREPDRLELVRRLLAADHGTSAVSRILRVSGTTAAALVRQASGGRDEPVQGSAA